MHRSIALLEEAMQNAREEFGLLELEDANGLAESAEKRSSLIKRAWEERDGCDEGDFLDLLLGIQELQRKLDAIARQKFAETREALGNQKKSLNAVRGYAMTGAGYGRRPPRIVTKMS